MSEHILIGTEIILNKDRRPHALSINFQKKFNLRFVTNHCELNQF